MKKFRGKRRYFRNLQELENVQTSYITLDKDAWFDFWHTHLDFEGIGNIRLKFRREHVKAHLNFYKSLLVQMDSIKKTYQSWVYIHMDDAGQDAVYIHTPNPNSDNFPYENDDIDWGCSVPEFLNDLVDLNTYRVGFLNSPYEQAYYIQAKSYGVPLQKQK